MLDRPHLSQNSSMDEDRLNKIEARLAAIEQRLGLERPLPRPLPPIPKVPSSLQLWLKENWLSAIGILLVILAGTWFIGYANQWMGEAARVYSCLAAGSAVYLYGFVLLKKEAVKGQILLLLGEAVIFMSLYAGYEWYALLPENGVFLLLFATAAITAGIGVFYNFAGLSFASVIAASVIPFLIGKHTPLFVINYVLLIDLAALFMYLTRSWETVFLAAWVATLYYSFSFFEIDRGLVSLYAALFYLLFFLPSAFFAIKKQSGAFILLTSTFALIAWMTLFVPFQWDYLAYSAAALLSLYICCKWENNYTIGSILVFNAMTFILMTVNSTNWPDIISYMIPIALAIGVARFAFQAPVAASGLAFFFLIPLALLYDKWPGILYAPFNSVDFATLVTAAGSLAASAWIVYPMQPGRLQRAVSAGLGVLTGLSLMALIWNICHQTLANSYAARGTALVLYIIAAEGLILKKLRLAGMALIVFVLGRLFLVELWEMPIVIRILTFVATGLLLIGTAWIDKKSR